MIVLLYCLLMGAASLSQAAESGCCSDIAAIVKTLQAQNKEQDAKIAALTAQLKNVSSSAAASQEPTSCPSGFTLLAAAKGCYMLNTKPMSWESAFNSCAALGANLAIIKNKEQNDAIWNFIRLSNLAACSSAAWIGMQRLDPSTCNGSPLVWKKRDGTTIALDGYMNWEATNPSCSGGTETCGSMFSNINGWNDVECSYQMCHLCQK